MFFMSEARISDGVPRVRVMSGFFRAKALAVARRLVFEVLAVDWRVRSGIFLVSRVTRMAVGEAWLARPASWARVFTW